MNYDFQKIEKKWQKYWHEEKTFEAKEDSSKEKYYVLDMFPYPSGAGLHVGHPEGYTATDIISRLKRRQGYNVLHPIGWDSFGLPAENYAIKTGVHPKESTENNIKTFKRQIQSFGFSYDWSKEISTCSPEYYRWTQWWFLFLYKQDLAYKKQAKVNWCNDCMTVLANEQVVNGKCERCKHEVIQKDLKQWFFKVTDFIEDQEVNGNKVTGLINGLDNIDWPNSTKINQKNWIGKSKGINITYPIVDTDKEITVFTTRPDTNFGATFIVIAPDGKFTEENLDIFPNKEKVEKYIKDSMKKTELDRIGDGRDKTGVFTGLYATNHLTKKKMPIWVGDFVLGTVGTGCVVAVPGHDLRDFEFAKKFNLEIIRVVVSSDGDKSPITKTEQVQEKEGTMINSEFLDGMKIMDAKTKIMDHLETKKWGEKVINYRLRDWLISRQRYWGTPIPIVYDPEGNPHPIPEKHLPWILPTDADYKPKGTSPLGSSKELIERTEKIFGKGWTPELDTMDTFVCSSWYFFRYTDPLNTNEIADKKSMKYWAPIDLYVGGAEHTVLHLLYARFFTKALRKAGLINFDEPFTKLRHQGMILGEDNQKMSKSIGNVINPDEIVENFGADTLRAYEMFMGPFEQMKPWNTKGVKGIFRFLERVWKLQGKINNDKTSPNVIKLTHKTIKKVTQDTENFKFNTAISSMMIMTNELYKLNNISTETFKTLIELLYPYAPHMSEELFEILGEKEKLTFKSWPKYNENLTIDNEINIVIQINGKLRGEFTATKDITKEEAIKKAKEDNNSQKYLEGKTVIKEIFVPGKLVNIVIKE